MVSIISNTQKENKPAVSVVMPVFNGEKTIANAINSILNQSFKDFELIIIDDGSSDNTPYIVDKFKDERIIYLPMPHRGMVSARNLANSMARADIIAFQDADDLSLPDRLEKCLPYFDAGADVVYHGIYLSLWNPTLNCVARKYIPTSPFNKNKLLKGQYIPGVCLYRKKCWEAKPFRYETEFAFDYAMHLDWALSGFKYKALNMGLYEYVRQNSSASITYEKDGRRKQSMDKIKEIVLKEYGKQVA